MVLPIIPYGNPILRKTCTDIAPDYEGLSELIDDMWASLYESAGVGLAAVQVGKAIRLFIVDSTVFFANRDTNDGRSGGREFPDAPGFKGVFINARVRKKWGAPWIYNEGCLSIPEIYGDVSREEQVEISFLDEHFKQQVRTFSGFTARVILHEYDHTEGKLFIDYLPLLKKKLIAKKLKNIEKGLVKMHYPILYS